MAIYTDFQLIILFYLIGIINRYLRTNIVINFIQIFKYLGFLSLMAVGYAIFSLYNNSSEISIEFAGGRNIQAQLNKTENYKLIERDLKKLIPSITIAQHGNNINIKYSAKFSNLDKDVSELLDQYSSEIIMDASISGSLSDAIKINSIYTLITVLCLIGVYIYLNFNLYYAIGAILALLHDIILSAFAIQYFGYEFSQYTVTALLIILGYSINDTVVIFDRIRINMKFDYKNMNVLINQSISQTLNRTVMTSISTIIPIIIVFFYMSEILKPMMMILAFGFIIGTYSSIFIASPIIQLFLAKKK